MKRIFGKKERLALFIIFLLALFLRVYQLGQLPNGFFAEEMTNSYVGRFIFLDGKDLYGNPWPLLYFDKFGDHPPVLPLYVDNGDCDVRGDLKEIALILRKDSTRAYRVLTP